jgi:hypothetical protein
MTTRTRPLHPPQVLSNSPPMRPVPTRPCPPPNVPLTRAPKDAPPLTVRDHFQWQLHWLYHDAKRAPEATVEQELRELRAMQRRLHVAMGYRVD